MNENHYQTLLIPNFSDLSTIKKAYKFLAQKYHPDKSDGNEELFLKVSESYNILIKTKSDYDLRLADCIFNKVHEVFITLEDAFFGCNVDIVGTSVRIPKQTKHNTVINQDNIKVHINIKEHDSYKINGDDLLIDLWVDVFDALLGATQVIELLSGESKEIVIPECCESDTILVLENSGFTDAGSLFVCVKIKMPKGLTKKDKSNILYCVHKLKFKG